ncbi:MAG TPA: VanZ family protein [Burkholderiales bacterium]|nr:VanZ family protein [Burkholderiales bacterium]
MPTERFVCLATGVGIMLALVFIGADRLPPHWDKVAHFVCFALITALVWRGTAGRAPLAVLAAVLAFSLLDELHHLVTPGHRAELADLLADASAAFAVAGVLLIRRKVLCAESSEQ